MKLWRCIQNLSKLKLTSPDKPVVKYGKNGTNSDIRYKYTLKQTSIKGPEAKAIRKSEKMLIRVYTGLMMVGRMRDAMMSKFKSSKDDKREGTKPSFLYFKG